MMYWYIGALLTALLGLSLLIYRKFGRVKAFVRWTRTIIKWRRTRITWKVRNLYRTWRPGSGRTTPARTTPDASGDAHLERVQEYPHHQAYIVAVIATVWTLLFGMSFMVEVKGISPPLLLLMIGITGAILSFNRVPFDEVWTFTTFYGYAVRSQSGGWCFAPPGAIIVHRYNYNIDQVQFPGNPEEVYLGADPSVPKDLKAPIRPTFMGGQDNNYTYEIPYKVRNPKTGKELRGVARKEVIVMPPRANETVKALNQTIAAVIFFAVRWRISHAFVFERHVGGKSMEAAVGQIRESLNDLGTRYLMTILQPISIAMLLYNKDKLNKLLLNELRNQTWGWGIEIESADLIGPMNSKDLNEALLAAANAVAKAQATRTDADADRYKKEREGDGAAYAQSKLLKAIADGTTKIAELAGRPGGNAAIASILFRDHQGPVTILGSASDVASLGAQLGAGLQIAGQQQLTNQQQPPVAPTPRNP